MSKRWMRLFAIRKGIPKRPKTGDFFFGFFSRYGFCSRGQITFSPIKGISETQHDAASGCGFQRRAKKGHLAKAKQIESRGTDQFRRRPSAKFELSFAFESRLPGLFRSFPQWHFYTSIPKQSSCKQRVARIR